MTADILKQCTVPEDNIYIKAIRQFGHKNQIAHTIEELGELATELAKNLAGKKNTDAIISEMADVENMLIQMKIIFDPDGKVFEIMDQKMKIALCECSKNCEACTNLKCVG